MTQAMVEIPDRQEIEAQGGGAIAAAEEIAKGICDPETYKDADVQRKIYRSNRMAVLEKFKPSKAAIDLVKKEILDLEKFAVHPWQRGEEIIDEGLTIYRQEQEAKAREAAAKEAREARRKADEEAKLRAAAFEAEGRPEEAQAVREEPPAPVMMAPRPAAPKLAGSSVRKFWKSAIERPGAINDELEACLAALAASANPADLARMRRAVDLVRDYCPMDEQRIGNMVRTQKELAVNRIPGVRVWCEEKTV